MINSLWAFSFLGRLSGMSIVKLTVAL